MSGPMSAMATSGEFAFNNVPMNSDFLVDAEKNDNYLNGVSTLDLVMIQRHILAIEYLDTPYKIIAADINDSGSIDGIDLVELRKLILGIYSELPQNDSWRFVESDYQFVDPTNPFPFSEYVTMNNVTSDINDANFIGVKIGDVNDSALPSLATEAVTLRNADDYVISMLFTETAKGNTVVELLAGEDFDLLGTQISMDFHGSEILTVVPEMIDFSEANVAWDKLQEGIFRISWNTLGSQEIEKGDKLAEILISGKKDEVLVYEDVVGFNQVYGLDGSSVITKQIAFQSAEGTISKELRLDQNVPNPFKDETTIGFSIPESGLVTLKISDMKGSLLHKVERSFDEGQNEIVLKGDLFDYSGLLYYQIQYGDKVVSKRMMVIK